jgi:hypothetical protein
MKETRLNLIINLMSRKKFNFFQSALEYMLVNKLNTKCQGNNKRFIKLLNAKASKAIFFKLSRYPLFTGEAQVSAQRLGPRQKKSVRKEKSVFSL